MTDFLANLFPSGLASLGLVILALAGLGYGLVQKRVFRNKLNEMRRQLMSPDALWVEDRQRREVASAIHDWLAQQLFGIRAKVTLLNYPDRVADTPQVVQEVLDLLDLTMEEARSLSFELFPPVLYEMGLEEALE